MKSKPYCRLCISMNGKDAERKKANNKNKVDVALNYSLSDVQSKISKQIVANYECGIDTLVNAVCGAGKTELVFAVIAKCLTDGKTVAFAVPRRDVVIELCSRLKLSFPNNKVISVYGGHNDVLEGDIVVLTTHQFYRYSHYFDLIILDEIDAFPFKNNKLLSSMFFRAIKGSIVVMSATPSREVINFFSDGKKSIIELNTRYHLHPLPVPTIEPKIGYLKIFFLVKKLREFSKENKKVFIFTPTISKCEKVARILKILGKNGTFLHSKCRDRSKKIKDFKEGKYDFLVTTAVLERGVTFKNLQVIIYDADNDLYTPETLIQIAGRVGRKSDAPEGEVIFLVNKETDAINDAISTIKKKNRHLQNMLP